MRVLKIGAAALVAIAAVGAAALQPVDAKPKAMLPDRTLTCRMGHATDVVIEKRQTMEEMTFDSWHQFVLHLPSIPVRTTPPPEAYLPPEKIAPGTRIVADPDGIAADVPKFYRVLDIWPQRVEILTWLSPTLLHLMIVDPIDPEKNTARLFMTYSNREMSYDPTRIYIGDCTVTTDGKIASAK